jgi:hypothetical protein
MQSQKITRATRALPPSMIDRASEESKLLERWAASDSARAFEDTDWDDSADLQDLNLVERPRDGYFS